MKTLDRVIAQAVPAAANGNANPGKPRASRQAAKDEAGRSAGRDHVDAINQVFAEFELAYHNQFHKAYAQEGSLNLAKKYWLNCLAEFRPEVIVRAARHVVLNQEYLPTVAAMAAACENAFPLFGLPPSTAAYMEAACAPEPKVRQAWSHPAVYLAGRETGWFALASETQAAIFPVFEYNYHQLCQRVVRGETLDISISPALPETVAAPLSPEENKLRMKKLRAKFDL